MKAIWKYTFEITNVLKIEMPESAEILTVQIQNDVPCMWTIVDSENKLEERYFRIFGTGHELPSNIKNSQYIGTFQLGLFVGHLFEVKK